MSVLYPGIADLCANADRMKTGCLDLPQVNHAAGWMRWSRIMIGAGYFKPFRPLIRIHQNPTQRCCRPHGGNGVPARRCLFIGDTTHDMQMAVAAGLGLSGFRGYHPIDRFDAAFRVAETPQSVYQAITDWLERDK